MHLEPAYADAEPNRAEVDTLPGATVLEFGNNWCGWCRRAQPLIAEAFAAHPALRHLKIADASGKRLGRSIGFPTLNIPWAPELRPRFGVYAVRLSGPRASDPLPGVANYGVRPTVENTSEPRLEVHVLGPCPFGEGDTVTVEWLRFVRPERKFAGIEELRSQIARDRAAAAASFASSSMQPRA